MHKKSVWVGFFGGLIVGLTVTSFAAQSAGGRTDRIVDEFFKPLVWLVSQVEANYVEEVDFDRLLVGAYQGVLSKLDRYCSYFPPDMYNEFQADARGEFGGLGMFIYFDPLKKVVVVEDPIPGTPAFREGVLSGDMIVGVQQEGSEEVVKTEDFDDVHDALRLLRGKEGTAVTITVIRGDQGGKRRITIKREIIEIPGVRRAQLMGPDHDIGYLYIAEFHEKLEGDLREEIDKLQEQGINGLILDMRFNRGGLLDAALQVSDALLDSGIIVSTKGRTSPLRVHRAEGGEILGDVPVVVLVNRYSASAAEIVTAALRDNNRARVVGEPTFGKASVQTIIESPRNNSAIKLTTGRYYTPGGELIEGKGVTPDIEVMLSDEDLLKLMGHLSRQLERARDEGRREEEAPGGSVEAQPGGPGPAQETPASEGKPPEASGEAVEEEFHDVQLDRAIAVMTDLMEGRGTEEAASAEADDVAVPAAVN